MVMKSARSIKASSSTIWTPSCCARAGGTKGSNAIKFTPNPERRSATSAPIRPSPTIPTVLSKNSTPVNCDRFHCPALVDALASGIKRASDNKCPIASSAAEITFEVGALTTMIPAAVAALMSTLSNPTPARATTTRSLPAAMTSASTTVALRTRSAFAPGKPARSAARSVPSTCRTSKSGPKASTVAGESSSAITTIGLATMILVSAGRRMRATANE
ncbi:unannotated protein [freshwater metagenome]|uniref:Unannotated protein n=1 Tax=freshwater metagenome TaxID=449393 RepID=A0A6J7D3V8_9ZZZZ